MRNWILLLLTRNLPARAIDLDGQHYIERYHVVRIGKLTIMLHRYLGSDGDRSVHDHPWLWSLGIPLVGGYSEERVIGFCPEKNWLSKSVNIRPWRWNFIGAMRFHRIEYVLPGTWTLFITYNRFKSWSFASNMIGVNGNFVALSQPYNVKGVAGWQKSAPKGKEFRVARGTDK